MKILIINPYYYPNTVGGTEIVIKLLAENLVNRGNMVAVYTLDNTGEVQQKEEINGVFVYRRCDGKYKLPLKKISRIDRINNAIIQRMNLWVGKELQEIIEQFEPDVVNTHNLYGFSTVVWRIIKKYNVPIVHTLNDPWLVKRTVFLFALLNAKEVDFVVAPSNFALALHMERLFHGKHRVIANGIRINEKYFEECISEKMKRGERQKIIFMFAGQLEKFKGIDILLNEFHNYSETNVELHIYGRGRLKDLVENFCKKDYRIIYHGFVMPEQLEQAYKYADVVIVPSVWEEVFGMVAIEAFYHGCIVIAGNRGGLKEIIGVIGVGKLVDPEIEGSICKALSYYVNRKNIKKDVNIIKEKICLYNIEYQTDQYWEVFCSLMKTGS